ncbi:MAG: hypothetical protein ACKVHP_25460 [Verrucomicrobiales bacterium]
MKGSANGTTNGLGRGFTRAKVKRSVSRQGMSQRSKALLHGGLHEAFASTSRGMVFPGELDDA